MNIGSGQPKSCAFSLIELMVVVAIIGILATMAVPSYENYMVAARIEKAGIVMQNLTQQAIWYAGEHKAFPSAQDLGLGTGDLGSDTIIQKIIPYYWTGEHEGYGGPWFFTNDNTDNASCGSGGDIHVYLDPVAIGFNGASVQLECMYWNYSDTFTSTCFTILTNNDSTTSTQSVPGFYNANTTPYGDENNLNAATTTYALRECIGS